MGKYATAQEKHESLLKQRGLASKKRKSDIQALEAYRAFHARLSRKGKKKEAESWMLTK